MDIQQTIFEPRRYLAVKKAINISQVTDKEMYDAAFQKLAGYMEQNQIKPVGPAAVVYLDWDEPRQSAEIAISFPVRGIDSVSDPELSLVDIPESKALFGTLYGNYSGLAAAHQAMKEHIVENKLYYSNIAIEEYVTMQESFPDNNATNVYYLYH